MEVVVVTVITCYIYLYIYLQHICCYLQLELLGDLGWYCQCSDVLSPLLVGYTEIMIMILSTIRLRISPFATTREISWKRNKTEKVRNGCRLFGRVA